MKTVEPEAAPPVRAPERAPAAEAVHAPPLATAAAAGAGLPTGAAALMRMQRTVGNAHVQRMLAQRSGAGPADPGVAASIADARGGGAGLGDGVRGEMESAFGADFRGVRVHTDARADTLSRALGARAFATGSDLFFRSGEFAPSSPGGRKLLAHELTHVVQQGGTAPAVQRELEVGDPDAPQEREAERAAEAVAAGVAASASPGGGTETVRRVPAPAAGAAAAPADAPVLAAGQNFAWVGPANAPELVLRRAWLLSMQVPRGMAEIEGPRFPGVVTPVISGLVDHFTWAAPNRAAIMARATGVKIEIPRDQWAREEITVRLGRTIYQVVGLPPNAPVQVFSREGGYEVYADLNTLFPAGATPDQMEQASPAIAERIVARLEEVASTRVRADQRPDALLRIAAWLPRSRQVAVLPLPEARLRILFGEAAWAEVLERREPGEGGAAIQVPGGGFVPPPGLTAAQTARLSIILHALFGTSTGPPTGPAREMTERDARTLLDIDAAPNRQAIIDAVRSARGGAGVYGGTMSVAEIVETAVAQDERRRAAADLGHTFEPPSDNAVPPVVMRPVRGRIVNRSGELVPRMRGNFEFELADAVDWLRVPHVRIQWYAVRRRPNGVVERVRSEVTSYIEVRSDSIINDRVFSVTFAEVGDYEIHAFVNHNFYLPAHFTIPVGVRTESERIRELEERSGAAGFGHAGPAQSYRFGDVRAQDVTTGVVLSPLLGAIPLGVYNLFADDYATGTRAEGELSDEAFGTPGGSVALARRELQSQIAEIDRLIAEYTAQGADRNADIIQWARERRARLSATQARLRSAQEATGTHPVMVQGHYVPRRAGMTSSPLRLAAWFTWTPGSEGSPGRYRAHLMDTTELVSTEHTHFVEQGTDFGRVMEALYFSLGRAYPPGTLTFSHQVFEGTTPTRRFVRLERVTDTLLGDVREVAFSEPASLVVNIGAAILTCFPPTAPVGIGISIAYNAANTALTFADAARSDTLRATNYVDVGMVALDALPLLGRGARVLRAGGVAYRAVNAAQYAGMVYAFTEGTYQQIEGLRDGQVSELARLQDRIRAMNPSDPALPGLRRDAEALRATIRSAAAEMFVTAAATQGITLLTQHAATRLAAHHLDAGQPAGPGHPAPRPGEEGAAPRPGEELPGIDRAPGAAVRDTRTRPGHDAALASLLPDDMRGRVTVHRGPPPEAHEVRVHYETDSLGLITDVYVRAGPSATPQAVAMHARTVRLMEGYRGFSGAARILWARLRALVSRRGSVTPGSALWEATLEVEKLPRIIAERARQLQESGFDPEVQRDLQADLEHLQRELERHRATVEQGIEEIGEGFVAATVPRSNAAAIKAGRPPLVGADAAPGHYYYEAAPGRFELRQYASSNDPPKRVEYDTATGRWRVVDRPARVRSFSEFIEAQQGTYGTSATPGTHAALEGVLGRRFGSGDTDNAGIAVARRWGATLEALHAGAGGGAAGDAVVGTLLDRMGATVTERRYGDFRRDVRAAVVSQALSQPHPAGAPDRRILRLRELMDTVPDPRTQGEIFTQFRERLAAEAGSPIDYMAPRRPASVDLPGGRHADGNATITRQAPGGPPPGEYLMEDKSGANAYRSEQSAFYSSQLAAGNGTVTTLDGRTFQGIIYVFDNEPAARSVLAEIQTRHPNIRVATFDPQGGFRWLR
jgi:hypothetical protein